MRSRCPVQLPRPSLRTGVCAVLAGATLFIAACGGDSETRPNVTGTIAVVGRTPIAAASYQHWLPIESHGSGAARKRGPAGKLTTAFLIRAQWLQQEAAAEGIDGLVDERLAHEPRAQAQSGMTQADTEFQARLNVIAEVLRSRHTQARRSISTAQIARYYAAHRTSFHEPATRETRMVVTPDRTSALQAKTALLSGERWAAVANRWSIDSSKLVGGAYAVVEGTQSPALVNAVFASRRDRLTGPVSATPAAQPGVTDYYLFEVTGGQPVTTRPLTQVAGQIRATLIEQERERSLAAFVSNYERHWKSRTRCEPRYIVTECRNDSGAPPSRSPTPPGR